MTHYGFPQLHATRHTRRFPGFSRPRCRRFRALVVSSTIREVEGLETNMKRLLACLFTVAMVAVGSGCGNESASPSGLAVSVSLISGSGRLSLEVGESVPFTVSTNVNGPYVVTWSTSDPTRISVDQGGRVRGLSAGVASVLAVLEFADGKNAQGRADLTVVP